MTLVLLGDSHMEEAGLAPGLVAGLRAEGLEPAAIHAHRGKGVRWYLDEGRLDRILADLQPTMVVAELGANDTASPAYERLLGQFVRKVKDAGAKIVWVGPPYATNAEVDARHRTVTSTLAFYLGEKGVPFIDARPMTEDLDHARDGVHFTRAGYDEWAARLAPIVAREIRALERSRKVLPIAVGLIGGVVVGGVVGAVVAFSR